jgi:hypothetical protein
VKTIVAPSTLSGIWSGHRSNLSTRDHPSPSTIRSVWLAGDAGKHIGGGLGCFERSPVRSLRIAPLLGTIATCVLFALSCCPYSIAPPLFTQVPRKPHSRKFVPTTTLTRARNVPKGPGSFLERLRGPESFYFGLLRSWRSRVWYTQGAIEGGFCSDGSAARERLGAVFCCGGAPEGERWAQSIWLKER